MKTSINGINFIKRFEGYSATPYLCPANHATIGYGHLIKPSEKDILPAQCVITRNQAEQLLVNDLALTELAITCLIKVPLSQNQFDALASFTFNLGSAALQRSTMRQMINRNEHQNAAAEFKKWVYSGAHKLPGLIVRRQHESILYLT